MQLGIEYRLSLVFVVRALLRAEGEAGEYQHSCSRQEHCAAEHAQSTRREHASRFEDQWSSSNTCGPGSTSFERSSDFDAEECITVIDPSDRVDLKSFSGNREQLLCLGSSTKQKICETTTGALTCFVWKEYLLKTSTSINIMSIHELEAAGGSAHFGTNDELRIKQTVSGTQSGYVYNNGEAILISPLGGGVEMVKKQRLHYLLSFSPAQYDSRQAEINSLLEDVHDSLQATSGGLP